MANLRVDKRSVERKAWDEIIRRCTKSKASVYPYYGGRGIKVCDRWLRFEDFLSDMGAAPTPKATVERLDPDKDYEKSNCRWETSMVRQARNKRNTLRLEDGTPLIDLCDAVGLPYTTVIQRIQKLGWTVHAALSTPARKDSRRKPPTPAVTEGASELVTLPCPHCGKALVVPGRTLMRSR